MKRRPSNRPTVALEREWAARLKQSGFQDLEGSDRDAPLSDRGNLHEAGTEGEVPLEQRAANGEAYIDWARDVSKLLNGHGPAAKLRAKIWRMHAEGISLKEISRELKLSFHKVRTTVIDIEEKYIPWKHGKTKAPRARGKSLHLDAHLPSRPRGGTYINAGVRERRKIIGMQVRRLPMESLKAMGEALLTQELKHDGAMRVRMLLRELLRSPEPSTPKKSESRTPTRL